MREGARRDLEASTGLPPPPAPPGGGAESGSGTRTPSALRVGGAIKAPRRVKEVPPVYPAAARAAGIQGVLILDVTIGADGKVSDVAILRGQPELTAAGIAAVRQWVYEPTIVDGAPVPVTMTVTVPFRLADPASSSPGP